MTDASQAIAVAERLQRNLAEKTRPANLRLTLSLGIFSGRPVRRRRIPPRPSVSRRCRALPRQARRQEPRGRGGGA